MKKKGRIFFIFIQLLLIIISLIILYNAVQKLKLNLEHHLQANSAVTDLRKKTVVHLKKVNHLKSNMRELQSKLSLTAETAANSPGDARGKLTLEEYLREIAATYLENAVRFWIGVLETETAFQEFLRSSQLKITRIDENTLALSKGNNHYFDIDCLPEGMRICSFSGEQIIVPEVDQLMLNFLKIYTTELDAFYHKAAGLEKELRELLEEEGLSRLITEKELFISKPEVSKYFTSIRLQSGRRIIMLLQVNKLHLKYRINGINLGEIKDVRHLIYYYLIHTAVEREINNLLESSIFTDFLDSRDLIIRKITENKDSLSLFLADDNNQDCGRLDITKMDSEVKIFTSDDRQILIKEDTGSYSAPARVEFMIPEEIPKLTSLTGDTTNILLIGAHTKLTDTMIIMHGNHPGKKLAFFSLPRDLYYKGRKLNAVYPWYGLNQLLRDVSEITGLQVTQYIFIDMYAFIDVINILGGVDVYLENPLYDSKSSMFRDNRRYPFSLNAGSHHLDGYNALAYVRSRKTTSDFDRARRQQEVLVSLKDKFSDLGVEDTDKILKLINTLVKNVETNLSPLEILSLFLKMKGYQVNFKNVLDTDNVLYHSWSNLYLLEGQDLDLSQVNRGQYILLPRKNNWDLIRWYIRELVQE